MKLYLSGLIKMGQLLRIDDHDPSFVHTYEACLRKVFAETGSGLSGRAQHIGQEGDGQPDIDLDPIGSHFPKIPGQLPQLGCQFPLHVDAAHGIFQLMAHPPHLSLLGFQNGPGQTEVFFHKLQKPGAGDHKDPAGLNGLTVQGGIMKIKHMLVEQCSGAEHKDDLSLSDRKSVV